MKRADIFRWTKTAQDTIAVYEKVFHLEKVFFQVKIERLLIITLLDYRGFSNNRVHHLIEQFSGKFREVAICYKKAYVPRSVSMLEQMKAFFLLYTESQTKGNLRSIAVNTLFNKPGGSGLHLLGIESPDRKIPKLKGFLKIILSNIGVVSELFYVPSFLIVYLLKIRKTMDVFIGQGPWEVVTGLLLKKIGRVKIVVYDDYDYAPGYYHTKMRKSLIGSLERYSVKKADITVSVGERLAKLRKMQTGKSVSIIPNGVNYTIFSKAQTKEPHPPTLLYMGFVWDWSGIDLVLYAMSHLKEEIPNIRFIVIGHTTPAYQEYMEFLVKKLALENHFEYIGNVQYHDLPFFLSKSDVGMAVFSPTELRKYAFSLKVIEYMAAALPVITTRDTQSGDIVRESHTGIEVEYSPPAIAEAVKKILFDTELRGQMTKNAVQFSSKLNWSSLLDQFYSLIREKIIEADTRNATQY